MTEPTQRTSHANDSTVHVAHRPVSRRRALQSLTALGVGTAVFRRALAQQASDQATVTPEMIQQAEWVAGVELTDEERESTARALTRSLWHTSICAVVVFG